MKVYNKLIVHGLLKINNKYLVIKRTAIKRGKPNSCPLHWDIPGGMVEEGELPTDALIRESKEEVNLDIIVKNIIQEDSNLDIKKNTIFTRLVYICEVLNNDISKIKLDLDEHDEYKFIESLDELSGEKVVDYLRQVFEDERLF